MIQLTDFKPKLFTTLHHYGKRLFVSDLMAGVIVGIVALLLAIAFAIAFGVSPEKGIVTAIVAGFIISFFGGSKVQIGGPTGAFIVIDYGTVQNYGIGGLTIVTLLAGIILILLGLFKLGTIIKFIPNPVIVGFASGIAVTIFTTQIPGVMGLDFGNEEIPGDLIGKWMLYCRHFDSVNWWEIIVCVVSVFVVFTTPRFLRKIPGSLMAIELGHSPKVRIIRMRKVPFIDSTGIYNLENLCKMSRKEHIDIVLSEVNENVHRNLKKILVV